MGNQSARGGFTLLEMAIVIAIIGLLVGGLMGIRTYLKGAQLTTTINQGRYQISAYLQFVERYNAPPGDYCSVAYGGTCWNTLGNIGTASNTWPAALNGDANGVLRTASSNCTGSVQTGCHPQELFYAFQHLALAGFISGTYTGATTGGSGTYYAKAGTNVPGTAHANTGMYFDHPYAVDGVVSSDGVYFDGNYGSVLFIAGLTPASTSFPNGAFLTPKEALRLDGKFDDGVPNTGWIMTANNTATGSPNCTSTTAGVTTYQSATSNASTPNCYFILRVQ